MSEGLCWKCRADLYRAFGNNRPQVTDFLFCHHESKEKPMRFKIDDRVRVADRPNQVGKIIQTVIYHVLELDKADINGLKSLLVEESLLEENPKCWCNWQSNHIFYYGEGLFKAIFCPECGRKL